ncbi:MAG: OmpA family protein [Bacteroidota bacterium]
MKLLFALTTTLFLYSIAAAQPRRYNIESNELKTALPVSFRAGTDIIEPSSDSALNEVKSYLTDKKAITLLRIEGHVAAGGDENKTLALTKSRAMAVAKWLVKNGVDPARIIAVAFGSTKPVADNSTPEGKALNTRISFINAGMLNRAIGGMPVDGGGQVVCNPCTF